MRALRSADRLRADPLSGSPQGNARRDEGPNAADAASVSPIRLIAVVGPTGTGKSDLALRIAERLGGEIVGCDAVQAYRELDAATGKPSPSDRSRLPHHLIDVVDPRRDFSLADYVRLASAAISEIASRGRVPVLAGGTGLYLRGLLRGVVPAPPRDEALRARLRRIAIRRGPALLHRWLERLDPASAERIPPRDSQRVVRAIEVAIVGGTPWSERLSIDGTWASEVERYRAVKIGLDMDRAILGDRLDARVDRFFESGLVEEVRALLDRGVPAAANAFKAIGYREVLRAVLAGSDPEASREEVRRSTRRYVKRQRTWFRREPGIVWLDASGDREVLATRALDLWAAAG